VGRPNLLVVHHRRNYVRHPHTVVVGEVVAVAVEVVVASIVERLVHHLQH